MGVVAMILMADVCSCIVNGMVSKKHVSYNAAYMSDLGIEMWRGTSWKETS